MYNYPPQWPPQWPPQPLLIQQERNYTPAAWLSAALSFLFVVPGLIATIIYLFEADSVRIRTGITPQGYGCLWAVFIWCVAPFVVIVGFMCIVVLMGVHP